MYKPKIIIVILLLAGSITPATASDDIRCFALTSSQDICLDVMTDELYIVNDDENLWEALAYGFRAELNYYRQVGFWYDLERWYDEWIKQQH